MLRDEQASRIQEAQHADPHKKRQRRVPLVVELRVVARVRRRHEPEAQQREEHERTTSNLLDHVGLELGGDLDLDHGWWWGASTLRGDPGVLMIAAARWCGADATLRLRLA